VCGVTDVSGVDKDWTGGVDQGRNMADIDRPVEVDQVANLTQAVEESAERLVHPVLSPYPVVLAAN
jgi:hypothetical protein